MSAIREEIIQEIDKATLGLRAMKTMAHSVYDRGEHLRKDAEELEAVVRDLLANPQISKRREAREALEKINGRFQRLRELRNMMELGSFEIEIGRAFETVWRAAITD